MGSNPAAAHDRRRGNHDAASSATASLCRRCRPPATDDYAAIARTACSVALPPESPRPTASTSSLVRVLWIIAGVAVDRDPGVRRRVDRDSRGRRRRRRRRYTAATSACWSRSHSSVSASLVAVDQVLPGAWHTRPRSVRPLLLIGGGIAILLLRRPQRFRHDCATRRSEPSPSGSRRRCVRRTEPGADGNRLRSRSRRRHASHAPPRARGRRLPPWPTPPRPWQDERRARRRRRPRPFLTPTHAAASCSSAPASPRFCSRLDASTSTSPIALAIATCFVGAVLALSAWVGRAHGLIVVGVLLASQPRCRARSTSRCTADSVKQLSAGDRRRAPGGPTSSRPGRFTSTFAQLAPTTTTDVARHGWFR